MVTLVKGSVLAEDAYHPETVADMVTLSPDLGVFLETGGYYENGGAGAGKYFVKTAAQAATDGDIVDEQGAGFTLANGNIAVLQGDGAIYVDQFGTKTDGTDTYAELNSAFQYAVEKGGGVVVFEGGLTYRSDTKIDVRRGNITIEGNGATIDSSNLAYSDANRTSGIAIDFNANNSYSTTLDASASAGDVELVVDDASGIEIGDHIRSISSKVLYHNGSVEAYYWDYNRVIDISGNTLTLEWSLEFDMSVSGETVSCITTTPISNVRVNNLNFIGGGTTQNPLGNGLGRIGLGFQRIENVYVNNCIIDGYQGFSLYGNYVINMTIDNCSSVGIETNQTVVEGNNSGFYGFVVNRGRGIKVANCDGIRNRHLIDGSEITGFLQRGCTATNTFKAALGSHEEVSDLIIEGNECYNCESAVVVRAYSAVITGNAFTTYGRVISSAVMTPGDIAGSYTLIGNNLKTTSISNASIIIEGLWDQILISGNNFDGGVDGINISGSLTVAAINGNVFNNVTDAIDNTASFSGNYRQVGNVSSSEVIVDV